MQPLDTSQGIAAFVESFRGFYDSVLVEVDLHLPREQSGRTAILRLLAQDSADEWRSVSLQITELQGYKLVEGARETYLVLSDGLRIDLEEDLAFVDLAPTSQDEPALWKSGQFLAGGRCWFRVEDVATNDG